jgi:hypothetical protein
VTGKASVGESSNKRMQRAAHEHWCGAAAGAAADPCVMPTQNESAMALRNE